MGVPCGDLTLDVMVIDDPVLPAAHHLVGDGAVAALSAAVSGFGGRLEHAKPCEVQYRPGRDLVVRYHAAITWAGRTRRRETLLASTTNHGVPAGSVPVEAVTEPGELLTVGVWRWPFDPELPGLTTAVTPNLVAPLVTGFVPGPFTVSVRAYRPTERAVVEIADTDGATVFLKVLPPASIEGVAERHRELHASGVPVPAVLRTDEELGIMVLAALRGRTLRQQLSAPSSAWPSCTAFREVFDGFARTRLARAEPLRSRASMALGHAHMLQTVVPSLRDELAAFDAPLRSLAARSASRTGPVIHGDLYDAQVISDGTRITGVLDIDDAGPGDPVDDRATVLGFLLTSAMHSEPARRRALVRYTQFLRHGFADGIDLAELDRATAAVLIGLATGPFRTQHAGWHGDVRRHVAHAADLFASAGAPVLHLHEQAKEPRHVTP